MADLIYSGLQSLDGYIADADGDFGFAAPDEEVHAFINDLQRPIGTYLYGRRMFETMRVWQTFGDDPDEAAVIHDFAGIWRGADKVVFSTTIHAVEEPRTRLERRFDAESLRALKADAVADLAIGGAQIAAHAIRAGLVDELQFFLAPVVVGGGTSFLPDDVRLNLELAEERRFASGMVFLRYRWFA